MVLFCVGYASCISNKNVEQLDNILEGWCDKIIYYTAALLRHDS